MTTETRPGAVLSPMTMIVVQKLLDDPEREHYAWGLARELNMNQTTAAKILAKLGGWGLLRTWQVPREEDSIAHGKRMYAIAEGKEGVLQQMLSAARGPDADGVVAEVTP